jgi:iron complex outermembrane receptor protein
LDPYRANALDLSYEKYFGTKGYVAAAAFYKDLQSWILPIPVERDFTGFPNASTRIPVSNLGVFTQPQNLKGGRISGIELAASVPLNLLTPVLDGFGVQASYAYTESSITIPGFGTIQIPGFSKDVATLTAYYEKYGFSARAAARNRSAYIAEVEAFGGDREFPFVREETVVDLQFGYEVQSGPVKGLNFLFQINNVNNEPYREFNPVTNLDTKIDKYGKTYLFGVTYKF